jgi:hypothetical protein
MKPELNMNSKRIKLKTMNKKVIIVILLALFAGMAVCKQASAQILIVDEDEFNQRTVSNPEQLAPVLGQGSNNDIWPNEYTPLGSGMWLLAGLGGAYLIGKSRKDRE